jgi:hypothetical protein
MDFQVGQSGALLRGQGIDPLFEFRELTKVGSPQLASARLQAGHRLLLERLIRSTLLDGFEIALECEVDIGEGRQETLKERLEFR